MILSFLETHMTKKILTHYRNNQTLELPHLMMLIILSRHVTQLFILHFQLAFGGSPLAVRYHLRLPSFPRSLILLPVASSPSHCQISHTDLYKDQNGLAS